jgi:hypothetical protein
MMGVSVWADAAESLAVKDMGGCHTGRAVGVVAVGLAKTRLSQVAKPWASKGWICPELKASGSAPRGSKPGMGAGKGAAKAERDD